MLMEQRGKAGGLCKPAKEGLLHCPLIARSTSEDLVTDHIVSTLRALSPRWWLPDLLNRALGVNRFERQVFGRLKIEPWQKQAKFPRRLIHWDEGNTEVDIEITWENPPTTVYVEMKYGSGLSNSTVHNDGREKYPSDQLIRNARVGLYQCGWYNEPKLFNQPTRDFVLLLITPGLNHPLVVKYRDPRNLLAAIPYSQRLKTLPVAPFIGELSYKCLNRILAGNRRWFSRPEKIMVELLTDYLDFKVEQMRERNGHGP